MRDIIIGTKLRTSSFVVAAVLAKVAAFISAFNNHSCISPFVTKKADAISFIPNAYYKCSFCK